MKINKLKCLLIATFYLVIPLLSKIQGMEHKEEKEHDRFSPTGSVSAFAEIEALKGRNDLLKLCFKSTIFTYDDVEKVKNLHVVLKGANWYAKEATEQDLPFYQQLFDNPHVMAKRTPRPIEERLQNFRSTIYRFQNGEPHGSLTIFNPDNQEKFGHVIAGIGDEPGASGIGYTYLSEYWGKGIGSSVVGEIVQTWAPEVRRIGLGENLDELQDLNIIKAFKCFGGKELSRLDASARSSNPRSWKILDKYFEPAVVEVQDEKIVVDFDNKNIDSFEALEEHILKLFDASTGTPLKVGIRYRLIDTEGKIRTFSKHEQYDRIRYHFVRRVE